MVFHVSCWNIPKGSTSIDIKTGCSNCTATASCCQMALSIIRHSSYYYYGVSWKGAGRAVAALGVRHHLAKSQSANQIKATLSRQFEKTSYGHCVIVKATPKIHAHQSANLEFAPRRSIFLATVLGAGVRNILKNQRKDGQQTETDQNWEKLNHLKYCWEIREYLRVFEQTD